MVLLFIADVILETSWWSVKKVYNGARYIIYGYEETMEDRILKELEEIRKQNERDKEELYKLRETMYNFYYKKSSLEEPITIDENIIS